MLEFTHVKAEGPCKLVVHGGNLIYETRAAGDSCSEAGSNTAVGVLVAIVTVLLRFVSYACYAVLVFLVIPVLRELVCALGAAAFFVVGWILRLCSACMLPVSNELAARSRLLRSCAHLLSYRPSRHPARSAVDADRVGTLDRRRVVDLRNPRPRDHREAWQQVLED